MAKRARETSEEDQKILDRFEKDFERGQADCKPIQQEYTADKEFVFEGKQWEPDQLEDRKGRPTMTVNKTLQFVMQVANDARQNNPAIKIQPAKEGATESLAEVRGGLVRAIERNSNAKAARQHALLDAIGAGMGFYRILTEFEGPDSFDQEIKIKRIMDASIVTWDNDAQEPDFSDAMFYVIQEAVSKQKFKREFDKDASDYMGGKVSSAWGTKEFPTLSEYWYVDLIDDTLFKMVTGENKFAAELAKLAEKQGLEELPAELYAVGEDGERISRPSKRRQVKWCKLAGGKVLEKIDWPGNWIPIVPVLGRETLIKGKRKLSSLIRPAKDSQRMYNYARSNMAERLSMANKSPWIVALESIPAAFKSYWATSNIKNWAMLPFKAYDAKGRQLPMPTRTPPMAVDQGLVEEAQVSTQELKETTGIYESGLGAKGNETSGRAILAREKQGDTATYDFTDNLTIAMRFEGMILNDLIPHVWDTARQIRILGEDDAEEVIMVNQAAEDMDGKPYHHDLSVGKYSVSISVGPSYATKRQETAESMMDLMKTIGPSGEAISDLAVRSQDWRGADVAADRLKKLNEMKFPGIVEPSKPKEGEEKQPDPAVLAIQQQAQEALAQKDMEAQAIGQQLQEAGQAADQATQENKQLKVANANKAGELELKKREQDLKEAEFRLKEAEFDHKVEMDHASRVSALEDKRNTAQGEQEKEAMETESIVAALSPAFEAQSQALANIAETNQAILAGLAQLGQVLTSPKAVQVHRDANGKITGATAQHVQGVQA